MRASSDPSRWVCGFACDADRDESRPQLVRGLRGRRRVHHRGHRRERSPDPGLRRDLRGLLRSARRRRVRAQPRLQGTRGARHPRARPDRRPEEPRRPPLPGDRVARLELEVHWPDPRLRSHPGGRDGAGQARDEARRPRDPDPRVQGEEPARRSGAGRDERADGVAAADMNEHLRLATDGAIATITLDRADKLNALTMAMLEALEATCARLEGDPKMRAVIVASSSPKAFCAGADIGEWGPLGAMGMWQRWIRDGHRAFDRLARLRQPTIAAVGGIAYGGGLELALACDLRIASLDARFAFPEVTIGAVPGWAGSQRLPRVIGAGRAKQLILSGDPVDVATAAAWGLVNEVVPTDGLAARALELARRIAENAPTAVQASKQLVDAGLGEGFGSALEALGAGLAASTGDAREGIAAFREKRKPKYTGS